MDNIKKEIFADGIGQIHFAGGMVRFDFVTLQPDPDGKGEPQPLCKERIIMPPQGFLNALIRCRILSTNFLKPGFFRKRITQRRNKGRTYLNVVREIQEAGLLC